MKKGNIYLIPSLLGGFNYTYCLPSDFSLILKNIRHFIVEDIRTARRFLKPGGFLDNFDDVTFYLLNKHTPPEEYSGFLKDIEEGFNVGLLSEAGCPCIADPGAMIVEIAHEKNIKVIPLVGPSSIMLALMASGFNGQNFAFLGYLPIKPNERISRIKELENNIFKNNQTQIFIETPYRNLKLFQEIIASANKNLKLCIACDLTLDAEFIITRTIADWKKFTPDIDKRQVVFLLYK